jgi:hypothetical protein
MDLNESYIIVDIPDDFIFIDKYDDLINQHVELYIENSFYDKLIQFNMNKWLENLNIKKNSKKNSNNFEQFVLDALRSNIYINNNYISDPVFIKNKYQKLDSKIKEFIWIFASQSAFVIPFELLNMDIMKKGYYLSELSSKDSEEYNINKKMIISITECTKKDYFVLKNSKVLRIFDLINDNDKTIAFVYIDLEFNINKPEDSFFRYELRPIKNL